MTQSPFKDTWGNSYGGKVLAWATNDRAIGAPQTLQ